MTDAVTDWRWGNFLKQPIRGVGISLHLFLRTLFGLFFLLAAVNKFVKGWMWTDTLQRIFEQRLTELNPEGFASWFLEHIGVPLYLPLAWMVSIGELVCGFGLLLGIAVRPSAFIGFLILFAFAIGGYYDASLIPFFIIAFVLMGKPSGHWLGFDRRLNERYPSVPWFR